MDFFGLSFLDFGWNDIFDIGIVAFILYSLYQLMQGTIGLRIFIGLLVLYGLNVIVAAFEMTMLQTLFGGLNQILLIAIIILFQPEIRRILLVLGQSTAFSKRQDPKAEFVKEITDACTQMAKMKIGALIVFTKSNPLGTYMQTGTMLDAQVSKDLLVSVFNPKSPLHDGAVIVENQLIRAARCILPVSQNENIDPNLGLRHRSAIGLTEESDALVVVVSEERGQISVVSGGVILKVSPKELEQWLLQLR
jgi:diadenylate cyclase